MRLIRIGLANINTTVGAFVSNTDKLIKAANEMAAAGCTIGTTQEQGIGGYPSEDLVQWKSFVSKQWLQLERFCTTTRKLRTVFTVSLMVSHKGHIYNVVATIYKGIVLGLVPKEKLPTYGVFYEARTISTWTPGVVEVFKCGDTIINVPIGDIIYEFPFGVVGTNTCEDDWRPDGPIRRRTYAGVEVSLNSSSSPFRSGVFDTRREMLATRSGDNHCVLVYTNQVGGNDTLVFDGGGFVYDNGRNRLTAERWKEQVIFCDVDLDRTDRLRHEDTSWRTDAISFMANPANARPTLITSDEGPKANDYRFKYPIPENRSFFIPKNPRPALTLPSDLYFEEMLEAQVLGLGDYFEKSGAFKRFGIAMSGGKDSALAAVIAWRYAIEKGWTPEQINDRIRCYSMPTRYNSSTTRDIAREICERFGFGFIEVSIEDEFTLALAKHKEGLDPGQESGDSTLQNIQARIRGEKMNNWGNDLGLMWIMTGNMSEKAVGYTTYGGDMMGALAPMANEPKTVVIGELAYVAEVYDLEVIRRLLDTKASAELKPGQEDEKDLMPFPVLDACFALFVGEKMLTDEVLNVLSQMWTFEEFWAMDHTYHEGKLEEWVNLFTRLFFQSIWKWVQTPEGLHLGSLDLDRERALQLPVIQSREWAI